jgi:hypothetical protein
VNRDQDLSEALNVDVKLAKLIGRIPIRAFAKPLQEVFKGHHPVMMPAVPLSL